MVKIVSKMDEWVDIANNFDFEAQLIRLLGDADAEYLHCIQIDTLMEALALVPSKDIEVFGTNVLLKGLQQYTDDRDQTKQKPVFEDEIEEFEHHLAQYPCEFHFSSKNGVHKFGPENEDGNGQLDLTFKRNEATGVLMISSISESKFEENPVDDFIKKFGPMAIRDKDDSPTANGEENHLFGPSSNISVQDQRAQIAALAGQHGGKGAELQAALTGRDEVLQKTVPKWVDLEAYWVYGL